MTCAVRHSEALRASARGGPMWWMFVLQDGLLLTHFISRPGDAHFCRAQYWVCQHLGTLMSQVCFPEQRDCSADTDLSRHISWVLIEIQESRQFASNLSPHMSSAKAGFVPGASGRSFLLAVDYLEIRFLNNSWVLAWDGGQRSQVLETWPRLPRRLGFIMKEFKGMISYMGLIRYPAPF